MNDQGYGDAYGGGRPGYGPPPQQGGGPQGSGPAWGDTRAFPAVGPGGGPPYAGGQSGHSPQQAPPQSGFLQQSFAVPQSPGAPGWYPPGSNHPLQGRARGGRAPLIVLLSVIGVALVAMVGLTAFALTKERDDPAAVVTAAETSTAPHPTSPQAATTTPRTTAAGSRADGSLPSRYAAAVSGPFENMVRRCRDISITITRHGDQVTTRKSPGLACQTVAGSPLEGLNVEFVRDTDLALNTVEAVKADHKALSHEIVSERGGQFVAVSTSLNDDHKIFVCDTGAGIELEIYPFASSAQATNVARQLVR